MASPCISAKGKRVCSDLKISALTFSSSRKALYLDLSSLMPVSRDPSPNSMIDSSSSAI